MGNRRRQDVWKYFRKVGENFQGKSKMSCNYCGCTYLENATRMATHLHKCIGLKHIPEAHRPRTPSTPNALQLSKVDQRTLAELDFRTHAEREPRRTVEEEDPKTYLARAIFSRSINLSTVDDPHFLAFLRRLQPEFDVPSKESIERDYLEAEHRKMQHRVDSLIKSAEYVVIKCKADGRNCFNVFLSTTKEEIFYKSFPKPDSSNHFEHAVDPLHNLICEIGLHRILGIVMDTPSSEIIHNFKIFEEKYPHLAVYQCAYKSFERLVEELLSSDIFKGCWNQAEELIAGINPSENEVNGTSSFSKQFPSYVPFLRQDIGKLSYILGHKEGLKDYAAASKSLSSLLMQKANAIILSDAFWEKIEKLNALLLPITSFLSNLEDYPVSHVFPFVMSVQSHFEFILSDSFFGNEESAEIMGIFQRHKDDLLHPVHMATNLLDPKSKGSSLTIDQQVVATEYIYALASHTENISDEDALADLANYRACYGLWGKEYIWKVVHKIHPVSWWNGFCSNTQLSKLAIRLFNLPGASSNKKLFMHCHQGEYEEHLSMNPLQRQMMKFLYFNLNLLREKDIISRPPSSFSQQEYLNPDHFIQVHKVEPDSSRSSNNGDYQEHKYF